jgi:hypothetical protein
MRMSFAFQGRQSALVIPDDIDNLIQRVRGLWR